MSMTEWVGYNPMTALHETLDGTAVAVELVDGVQCLSDVLRIAQIREEQRAAMAADGCSDSTSCPRGER